MKKKVQANPGESVYTFLNRVLMDAEFEGITHEATHNGITINVYPHSYIADLCDKYDITRKYQ